MWTLLTFEILQGDWAAVEGEEPAGGAGESDGWRTGPCPQIYPPGCWRGPPLLKEVRTASILLRGLALNCEKSKLFILNSLQFSKLSKLRQTTRPGHSLFFSRFTLCSPLIFYPWIAIALSLILPIFRFAHRSIALKKPVVHSWKRALKRSIAPKTTAVRSYVCMVYCIYRYICT